MLRPSHIVLNEVLVENKPALKSKTGFFEQEFNVYVVFFVIFLKLNENVSSLG